MAYRIERNNLNRYQGKRSDVAVCHDFHAAGDTDGSYYVDDSANKYYRIANISKYATQVKITDENHGKPQHHCVFLGIYINYFVLFYINYFVLFYMPL